jgi:hypothetical protein
MRYVHAARQNILSNERERSMVSGHIDLALLNPPIVILGYLLIDSSCVERAVRARRVFHGDKLRARSRSGPPMSQDAQAQASRSKFTCGHSHTFSFAHSVRQ